MIKQQINRPLLRGLVTYGPLKEARRLVDFFFFRSFPEKDNEINWSKVSEPKAGEAKCMQINQEYSWCQSLGALWDFCRQTPLENIVLKLWLNFPSPAQIFNM